MVLTYHLNRNKSFFFKAERKRLGIDSAYSYKELKINISRHCEMKCLFVYYAQTATQRLFKYFMYSHIVRKHFT